MVTFHKSIMRIITIGQRLKIRKYDVTLTFNIKLKAFKHTGCIFFKLLIGQEAVLSECEYHAVKVLFCRHIRLSHRQYQQHGWQLRYRHLLNETQTMKSSVLKRIYGSIVAMWPLCLLRWGATFIKVPPTVPKIRPEAAVVHFQLFCEEVKLPVCNQDLSKLLPELVFLCFCCKFVLSFDLDIAHLNVLDVSGV